jgi:dipeptidyl aminopeptidase/acylaminoacyl peptidase
VTTPASIERKRAPLFESARTIARHRRAAYVACGIVVAGLVIGVFVARDHRSAAQGAPRPNPALIKAAVASSPARNGPLTVIAQDSNHSGIYTLRSDGGLRKLVDCPETKCPVLQSFAWAPSGQLIAFDVSWEPPGDSTDYEGIHILNLSTGADQRITRSGWRIDDLAWSPDGSRLAYVIDNEAGTAREIRVIAADGSSPSMLVETGVGTPSSPTWSSDGKRLAYAVRRGDQSSVYISTLDQVERRLAAVDASAPAWSPGGTVLAVRSCHGINLLTPAGRNVTPHPGIRPCPAFGVAGRPVWSPDGRRIAVQTYHGIYAMNSDGTSLRRLTTRLGRLGRWGGPRPSWRPLQ